MSRLSKTGSQSCACVCVLEMSDASLIFSQLISLRISFVRALINSLSTKLCAFTCPAGLTPSGADQTPAAFTYSTSTSSSTPAASPISEQADRMSDNNGSHKTSVSCPGSKPASSKAGAEAVRQQDDADAVPLAVQPTATAPSHQHPWATNGKKGKLGGSWFSCLRICMLPKGSEDGSIPASNALEGEGTV